MGIAVRRIVILSLPDVGSLLLSRVVSVVVVSVVTIKALPCLSSSSFRTTNERGALLLIIVFVSIAVSKRHETVIASSFVILIRSTHFNGNGLSLVVQSQGL